MQARAVTVIPQRVRPFSQGAPLTKRRKVAAYARVSTDNEEQLTSYEAQVDYYTNYIKNRSDWEFAGLYTDEGISATNTKHRDGFNQMVADALAGKIDLIITKSVSRFARNTVDSLVTVRKLKERGVEVYFEKENIYTLDSKGELLITIMSSLAQEESRSISENTTWGQRKRFADGKMSLAYSRFLGYKKDKDDTVMTIVESEAGIVRLIFRLFMLGKTPGAIAKHLEEYGILTATGKTRWQSSTISSILTNEKYKGDALLQKHFTVDFLTKKLKRNEGEVPQYYVQNSHEPIISPEDFDRVQAELVRRRALGKRYSGRSPFSSRILCGDCGCFYGSKVWHSTDKYRRTVWQCNDKFKNAEHCQTPHISEDDLKAAFLIAFAALVSAKDEIIANCRLLQLHLTDCTDINESIAENTRELDVVSELIRKLISDNAHRAMDQNMFDKKYASLSERFTTIEKSIADSTNERIRRGNKHDELEHFICELSKHEQVISEFDEQLWCSVVDTVTVCRDGKLRFLFRNGTEIKV